jgi:hypothetical protein
MWKEFLPEQCPPQSAEALEAEVYRILKSPTPTEDDFVPYSRLHEQNTRYNNLCSSYAISFFNSISSAEKALESSIIRGKALGTHIGLFHLKRHHGVSQQNSSTGHINTWLYKAWSFSDFEYSKIIEQK